MWWYIALVYALSVSAVIGFIFGIKSKGWYEDENGNIKRKKQN